MPAFYVIHPRHFRRWLSPSFITIDCPHKDAGCPFVAVREREGEAINAITKHLVKAHHATEQETK